MGLPELSDEDFAGWWGSAGEPQLAEILYWLWDPIGVNDAFPLTRGEYDGYLNPIASELKRRASAQEIEDLLARFEKEQIGLYGIPLLDERRPRVAKFIADEWFDASVFYWQDRAGLDWRHA